MSSCFTSGLYLRSQDNSVSLFPRSCFTSTIHETNIFSLCTSNPAPVLKKFIFNIHPQVFFKQLPHPIKPTTHLFSVFSPSPNISIHELPNILFVICNLLILPILPSHFPCTKLVSLPSYYYWVCTLYASHVRIAASLCLQRHTLLPVSTPPCGLHQRTTRRRLFKHACVLSHTSLRSTPKN
jgi:hypothetical protein